MKTKNLKSKGLLLTAMLIIVLVAGCLGNSNTVKGIKNDTGDAKNWIADKFAEDEAPALYLAIEVCNETCAGNFLFSQENKTKRVCVCL